MVNPAKSAGTRFLLTSIAMEVTAGGAEDGLEEREVELRDALIIVLGAKTVEELTDISNRDRIAQEIFVVFEEILGKGLVHRIYIPQFVIQ